MAGPTGSARPILFVLATGYLPERVTGANISLHSLCRRLAADGHEPVVVCAAEPPSGRAEDFASLAPSYTVLRLEKPVDAMLEMIPALSPAAVVVRAPWPAAVAVQRAGRRRLHLYFETGFFGYEFPPAAAAPHLRFAACSPFLARLVSAYAGGRVATIPPLIDPEDYRCDADGDAVLFVNPVALKGVHLAAVIAERMPHRRFLFVEAWPDRSGHRRIDVRLPNVEWAPSTLDMRAHYARARLLLVPSVWEEAFGRVVVEAQISGIPCVASDRGGLPETVGAGGVVLSLAEPIDRWCEAVEAFYTDRERYAACSRAAKANAARPEYSPQQVLASFREFLSS